MAHRIPYESRPLRRVVTHRVRASTGLSWNLLECGHRVQFMGEYPNRQRCEDCWQINDAAQLRLW